jgi:hypothetical protein
VSDAPAGCWFCGTETAELIWITSRAHVCRRCAAAPPVAEPRRGSLRRTPHRFVGYLCRATCLPHCGTDALMRAAVTLALVLDPLSPCRTGRKIGGY